VKQVQVLNHLPQTQKQRNCNFWLWKISEQFTIEFECGWSVPLHKYFICKCKWCLSDIPSMNWMGALFTIVLQKSLWGTLNVHLKIMGLFGAEIW